MYMKDEGVSIYNGTQEVEISIGVGRNLTTPLANVNKHATPLPRLLTVLSGIALNSFRDIFSTELSMERLLADK